jgi:hypothetical protein
MTATAFCPQCGNARAGGLRFCGHCGFDFWKHAGSETVAGSDASPRPPQDVRAPGHEGAPQPSVGETSARAVVLIAGIAFLLAAAAIGYLAFLQLEYSSLGLGDADTARVLAIWNLVAAGLSALAGGKALVSPNRRSLITGALWGGLNVVLGGIQIAQGITHESFVIATVCFGIAGLLSALAAGQYRAHAGAA